jgi:hypothetical protein
MLKNLLFGALAATLLFSGCSNDDDDKKAPVPAVDRSAEREAFFTGGSSRTWKIESITDEDGAVTLDDCDKAQRETFTKADKKWDIVTGADCFGTFNFNYSITNNGDSLRSILGGIELGANYIQEASDSKFVLKEGLGTITYIRQ